MLRTALRPRWLALLAVVLVAVTAMAKLGEWQLSRAREHGAQAQQERADRPAVPLTSLLGPRAPLPASIADRRVQVAGTWDRDRQLLVADRTIAEGRGLWVLTPLRLPDGSAVPVVRGWVTSPQDPAALPPALPGGTVRVEGVLRPTESAVERAPGQSAGLPPGQIDRVDVNALVQRWPYPLFTGFVLLTDQAPAPPGPALALVPPVTSTDSGLDLRNLSYALQWWLFAAFGLFFWWRVVRDDHQGRTSPDDAPAEAAQADGAPVTTPSRGAQP